MGGTAASLSEWFLGIISAFMLWIVSIIGKLGYIGIIIFMGLEASFIPFPSEVVVPPAGYLAAHGQMNIALVVIFGITGSIIGSLVNYFIAVKFGRSFLLRHAKFFLLNEERFIKFEKFFFNHGEITTFVCRLMPVIRQYISFLAGLAKMNLLKFIAYTALGASFWVVILAYVGYFVGNNIELVKEHIHTMMYIVFPVLAVVVLIYIVVFRMRKKKGASV